MGFDRFIGSQTDSFNLLQDSNELIKQQKNMCVMILQLLKKTREPLIEPQYFSEQYRWNKVVFILKLNFLNWNL